MDLPMPAGGPAPDDWVPADACTLPTADRPLRLAEFDDLFARALRAIERPDAPGHARLVLAGGVDLPGRVRRLADAETACCSFFTFTIAPLIPEREDPAPEAVLHLRTKLADIA
jgi:hypothetical protein